MANRSRKKSKAEERLEVGRRLLTIFSLVFGKGTEVLVLKGRKGGYTVLTPDGKPATSFTEERAARYLANPALVAAAHSSGLLEYVGNPIVQALNVQAAGGIWFDWINPNDIDAMLAEGVEDVQSNRRG